MKAEEAWPPQKTCDELGLAGLCEVAGKIHIERSVLAAVSNKNIFHMLQLFVNGIKAVRIITLPARSCEVSLLLLASLGSHSPPTCVCARATGEYLELYGCRSRRPDRFMARRAQRPALLEEARLADRLY